MHHMIVLLKPASRALQPPDMTRTASDPVVVAIGTEGAAPVLASAPLGDELAMQGYAGSVALSGDGTEFVISSPRGGRCPRVG